MPETMTEADVFQPEQNEQVAQTQQENVVDAKQEDLISRVSKFQKPEVKLSTEQTDAIQKQIEDGEFNFNDIEKITDPVAKEYATKAYKSFQRGFNQKFQELASIRKELEAKTSQVTDWTPDKVQSLLNDPRFLDAAKKVSGVEEEEFVNESDAKIKELERKLTSLETQKEQERLKMTFAQQDSELKSKYHNYRPEAIDSLMNEMMTGKVSATREHLWKVLDYEDAVRRAYELGKTDKVELNSEKVNAISASGLNIPKSDPISREKGEPSRSVWDRIIAKNIQLAQGGNQNLRK